MIEQHQHDDKLLKERRGKKKEIKPHAEAGINNPCTVDSQKNCMHFIAGELGVFSSPLREGNYPQQNWDLGKGKERRKAWQGVHKKGLPQNTLYQACYFSFVDVLL
uniref:Uncharacterized protein n=1 Tax=Micrurus lemniscatus lemniscatus TaxID=129467 RepID=A0A2D4JDZ1_MICLE